MHNEKNTDFQDMFISESSSIIYKNGTISILHVISAQNHVYFEKETILSLSKSVDLTL